MSTHQRHVPAAQRPTGHAGAIPATPPIAEIEQEATAPHSMAVLVETNGPVATRALPTRVGTPACVVVGTGGAQILGRDLRRARVTLLSTDNPIYIASREQPAYSTATAALWPANVPLVLLHGDAIVCACATAGQSSTITVIPENMDGS